LSFRDEVMWLAGLLEGEGYFAWRAKQVTPMIQLGMTDRDVVEKAYNVMGLLTKLTVRQPPGPRCREVYSFSITGSVAAGWMMMLYPYMGERRRAAILSSLQSWKSRPPSHQYRERCLKGHRLDGWNRTQKSRFCVTCKHASSRRSWVRVGRETQRRARARPVADADRRQAALTF
jgi:hypothetical protein